MRTHVSSHTTRRGAARIGVAGVARAQDLAAAAARPSRDREDGVRDPRWRLQPLCRRPGRRRSSGSLELCFDRQGNSSTVDNDTYLYWIKLPISQPSQGKFVPYDDSGRAADARRTSRRSGTPSSSRTCRSRSPTTRSRTAWSAKMVVYRMEERERVKIVDYRNTKGDSISIIKRSDIDEKLRERNIEVRLDSFLDEGSIRRVEGRAPRADGGEGLHQRRDQPQGHAGRRRSEARERDVHRRRRAEDQDSRRRVRRQPGDRRRQAAEEDEGEQAEGHPLVHHRRRHVQGGDVRGGRRQGRGVLPATRATRRPVSAIPRSRRSRTPRTARPGGCSCASR